MAKPKARMNLANAKQRFDLGLLFFKTLRFLNLLEPGTRILSLSKIFLWESIALTGYVAAMHPDQANALLATGGQLMGASVNYAYRRWTQAKYPDRFPATTEQSAVTNLKG